jgi:hypothetical protein
MVVTTEIKNPTELRKVGMKALADAMGNNNAQEFVRQCRGTPGWDFTKWLSEQPEQSDDEIEAEIERIQAEDRTAGIPDCTGRN